MNVTNSKSAIKYAVGFTDWKLKFFMAKIDKHPLSAKGKYYVDADVCLICDCCAATAPNNFNLDMYKPDVEYNCAYVFKQPTTPEEEKQCEEALHCCPVEAIGNDGLSH